MCTSLPLASKTNKNCVASAINEFRAVRIVCSWVERQIGGTLHIQKDKEATAVKYLYQTFRLKVQYVKFSRVLIKVRLTLDGLPARSFS